VYVYVCVYNHRGARFMDQCKPRRDALLTAIYFRIFLRAPVCVCVCVSLYVYVWVCTCVCTATRGARSMGECNLSVDGVLTAIWIFMCLRVSMCTCACVHMRMCVRVWVCVCMCVQSQMSEIYGWMQSERRCTVNSNDFLPKIIRPSFTKSKIGWRL